MDYLTRDAAETVGYVTLHIRGVRPRARPDRSINHERRASQNHPVRFEQPLHRVYPKKENDRAI